MNGALGSITRMYVRRDKLVANLPLVHNGGLEFGADFIVEDLEINVVPMIGEAVHDGAIGGQLVFVRPVNIRGTEDCVAAAVEGNGDVLVGTLPKRYARNVPCCNAILKRDVDAHHARVSVGNLGLRENLFVYFNIVCSQSKSKSSLLLLLLLL